MSNDVPPPYPYPYGGEQHPYQQPPYGPPGPAPAPAFRGNQGLSVAVIVLSSLLGLAAVLSAVLAPYASRKFREALDSGLTVDDVFTAYDLVAVLYLALLPTLVVTGLWLGVARSNAARLAPQEMRRSAVWVWLGWCVPIVSFWFPKQIVDDVLRVTERRSPAQPANPSTGLWWGLWIATAAFIRISSSVVSSAEPDLIAVLPVVDGIGAVVTLAGLFFWIRVVLRITAAQTMLVTQGPPPLHVPTGWS